MTGYDSCSTVSFSPHRASFSLPGSLNAATNNELMTRPKRYLTVSFARQFILDLMAYTRTMTIPIPPPFASPYSVPWTHNHAPVVPSQTPVKPRIMITVAMAEKGQSPPVIKCPPAKNVVWVFSNFLYRLTLALPLRSGVSLVGLRRENCLVLGGEADLGGKPLREGDVSKCTRSSEESSVWICGGVERFVRLCRRDVSSWDWEYDSSIRLKSGSGLCVASPVMALEPCVEIEFPD